MALIRKYTTLVTSIFATFVFCLGVFLVLLSFLDDNGFYAKESIMDVVLYRHVKDRDPNCSFFSVGLSFVFFGLLLWFITHRMGMKRRTWIVLLTAFGFLSIAFIVIWQVTGYMYPSP